MRTIRTFRRGLRLLPEEALLRTGPVDHADWNFRPILGLIQRARFQLALGLLPAFRVGSLLEIGYGSGVFLPALAQRCDELLGVDIHARASEVEAVLSQLGVGARLFSASAAAVPLPTGSIDCVVAVSTLEFVDDLAAVCHEVARLLRPAGCFVVVTPRQSPVVDACFRLLTGMSAQQDFGDRRALLVPTLLRHFRQVERRSFPRRGGALTRLYTALRLTPVR